MKRRGWEEKEIEIVNIENLEILHKQEQRNGDVDRAKGVVVVVVEGFCFCFF